MAAAATHNGTLTISNPATGNHRTVRIRTQRPDAKFAPGQRIVYLRSGPKWEGFAFVGSYGPLHVWKSKRGTTAKPSHYERLADILDRQAYRESRGFVFEWAAKCRKCNRRLTNPKSLAEGIGPECSKNGR